MNKYICIDAGHGGKDSGATKNGRLEKNDTLNISLKIKSILEKQGIKVLLTRSSDTFPSLIERTNLANKEKVTAFISIHRNSFNSETAQGFEIWKYLKTPSSTDTLSEHIKNGILEVGVSANRGVKKGDYHVLRETDMDAVLIELGFISNNTDNDLFDKNIDRYAEEIAKRICEVYSWTYNPSITPPSPEDKKIYTVQTGSFEDKNNAIKQVESLRKIGIASFVKEV